MQIVGFDIETIPNMEMDEDCLPKFDPESVKLGNLKDPSKVAAKIISAEEKFKASISKTMSLDPAYALVCTFAAIKYDTQSGDTIDECLIQTTDGDDYEAVSEGWGFMTKAFESNIPAVSFNGKGFDLPVMLFAAMRQDVPVRPKMYNIMMSRYGNNRHYDLLQDLAGRDRARWHNFDFYLKRFAVGSKGGMDGSQVWPAYQEGRFDDIKEYCYQDALNVCRLFSRVEPWIAIKED